jgi:Ca2+-binding RTX toxin-like protein
LRHKSLGNDLLNGGTDNDTASFPGNSAVNANLTTGVATGQGSDTLQGVENLTGSDSHIGDVLIGNNVPNILDGRGGPDLLDGRGGADTLLGGLGDDEIRSGGRCAGDGAVDTVDGGAGNDTAIGVLNDPDTVINVETVMC